MLKSKLTVVAVLVIEMIAIVCAAAVFFSPTISGAIAQSMPSFCFAIWVGFLVAGTRELKAHLGVFNHAAIFLGVFLITAIPLLYVHEPRMFATAQEQTLGKVIVTASIIMLSLLAYRVTAALIRKRKSRAA